MKPSNNPANLTRLLSSWRADPAIGGNVAVWHSQPARPAMTAPIPDELHPLLRQALESQGIHTLYTHQLAAWQALKDGENVIVAAGVASGKSLCYNLPVVERLLSEAQATALYLYPTKALAQDQAAALRKLSDRFHPAKDAPGDVPASPPYPIGLAIYDGDTPAGQRAAIRNRARLLLSNPDMLHVGILPHHTAWAAFWRGLSYVVLDEAHMYRGVFGSHLANLLRRLRRIAGHYGARPQFILTSATLANPGEFAERLLEAPARLIDEDGSGRGPRHFLIYNPPVIDAELGLRRSAILESVRLVEDALAYGLQTIIFTRSRRSVEILLTYLRERAPADGAEGGSPFISGELRGYRSGYLPGQRRAIEQGLRSGQVRAVVATNALELGIDIGSLEAAVLVGYPGSVAATRQQAGRAGRGAAPALAVLVAAADPLDQFLVNHPDYLLERSPEHALLDANNLVILLDHIRCAAFELPFKSGDAYGALSAEDTSEFLELLAANGEVHRAATGYFWMSDQYPAQRVSLRNISANPVVLQAMEGGKAQVIGQVDFNSAAWMVHPGAIYLHEAQMYAVEELDLEGKVAYLQRGDYDYYTQAQRQTELQLVELHAQAETHAAQLGRGEVLVASQVTGFQRIRWYTHETLGVEALELPKSELITSAYWITLKDDAIEKLRQVGLWRGDPNNYGPDWPRLRQAARVRDGFRCRVCGAPESGRAHDVHHKIPFRRHASWEAANQLENLITLCPACHRRAETAVRMRSGLAGLAYVLGGLAPFFVMCDPSDLGVYYDPQSAFPGAAPEATPGARPTVALYEQAPGGIGLSQRLFELHSELVARAAELVSACACVDGCPSCTGPGGEQGAGGKGETLAILHLLAQAD